MGAVPTVVHGVTPALLGNKPADVVVTTTSTEFIKHNLTALVAPTTTDDSTAGYAVGSRWIDTVAKKRYECLDATATAAVWKDLTATVAGGDVLMSEQSGDKLANAISAASPSGRVVVDTAQTLSATTYTVPPGVTLITRGQVLSLVSGTTFNHEGAVLGHEQLWDHDDHANRGTFNWKSRQHCNARWWGMKSWGETGEDATGTANRDAFLSAWIASRDGGVTVPGAALVVPPGVYRTKFIDIATDAATGHPDLPVIGDGATFYLPDAENTQLFKVTGLSQGALKETKIQGFTFNGNKANNTLAADTGLVQFSTYDIELDNIHVVDSKGDGLDLSGSQRYKLTAVECDGNDGWGCTISGANDIVIDTINIESSGIGGLRILNDSHHVVVGQVYVESTPIGVQLEGCHDCHIDSITAAGSTLTLKVAKDTTANKFARYNVVNLRSTVGDVTIDAGNYPNTIIRSSNNPNVTITDDTNGGIDWRVLSAPYVKPIPVDFVPTNSLIDNSNPAEATATATLVRTAGCRTHPASAWMSSENGPVFMRVTPPDSSSYSVDTNYQAAAATGTHYLTFLLQRQRTAYAALDVYDTTAAEFYNFETKAWQAGAVSAPILHCDPDRLAFLEVPIEVDTTGRTIRVRIYVTNWSTGAYVDLFYFGASQSSGQGFVYVKGATQIGDRQFTKFTTALRPDPTEVPEGTEIFDTDLATTLKSDGTNWKRLDPQAVHADISAEISALTEKVSPVSGDWLLIEDSAASDAKKKVQVGNLPASGGTPGGSDTQYQYNNGGAFGGTAGATYNDTTHETEMAAQATTSVPLTVKAAASHTANIYEGEDSVGADLWAFDSGGNLGIGIAPSATMPLQIGTDASDQVRIRDKTDSNFRFAVFPNNSGHTSAYLYGGSTNLRNISWGMNNQFDSKYWRWGGKVDQGGAFDYFIGPNEAQTGVMGIGSDPFVITDGKLLGFGAYPSAGEQAIIASLDAANAPLTLKHAASPTAVSFDVQDSVGTTLVEIDKDGRALFKTTDNIRIPVGTTAQRPGTPADGDLRVNTTTETVEAYRNSNWRRLEGQRTLTFALAIGTDATTGTNKTNELQITEAVEAVKCYIHAKTVPTGAALIVDINKNGTSIFGATKMELAAADADGKNTQATFAASPYSFAEGDMVTIDVDQIGSTIAGKDITVQLVLRPA